MNDMTNGTTLLRLMTWLSPSFPTGTFAYSQGLESAVAEGLIRSRRDIEDWLCALLEHGSIWNDAVFCAEAWRLCRDRERLAELKELAAAVAGSMERYEETTAQGAAFLAAAVQWQDAVPNDEADACPLPITLGSVAGRLSAPLEQVVPAYMHAMVSNLVQAVLRLGLLGQREGVGIVAALEGKILEMADRVDKATLDDLGGAALIAEIMAMRHETMEPRIFRS